MPAKLLFEYALIRLVPLVEREEFLNVGVILYCPDAKFLETVYNLSEERILNFAPKTDLFQVTEHLEAFRKICQGQSVGGEIGRMSLSQRFRWLTAPRSTIIQTSPVHLGLTEQPVNTLEQILNKMVG
jgi:hypothetical protein